jgi:ABC-2 type transport system ATP-binding protein
MIEISALQKVIDGQTALEIDSLEVNPGEIAGMVGPIDNQKGVLFDLLIGQDRPTAGFIRLAGIDPYQDKGEFSQKVGVVFGDDNLYKRQSPRANLEFYRRLYRLPQARVEEILLAVGLADHADTSVEKLTTSLSRRLAFGRAILHHPSVLILDEPFAQCDAMCVSLISDQIRQLTQGGGAVLILANDDDHLNDLCNVIYNLDQGRVIDSYRPAEEERQSLPFMIPAKLEHTVALVEPADIYFVYAQDDHTYLQTEEGSLRTQFTMSELEERLSRRGFFRAHRGYLVNLQHVKEVIPYTRDSFSLRMKDEDGTKIPLSKSAARDLRDILGY